VFCDTAQIMLARTGAVAPLASGKVSGQFATPSGNADNSWQKFQAPFLRAEGRDPCIRGGVGPHDPLDFPANDRAQTLVGVSDG